MDIHVGGRIRLRRTVLGITQEKLGESLGLTLLQVQRYERGTNSIWASHLFNIARVLDVPIDFFFDDIPHDVGQDYPCTPFADLPPNTPGDQTLKRDTLELLRAYYRIPESETRQRVYRFTEALAEAKG